MTLITRAEDVSAELNTRALTITKAQGAETDVGTRVLRGRRKIDDEQVPCVVIVEGLDTPKQGESMRRATSQTQQSYVLVGYHKCDPDHPNDVAHAIIRDLKRAVFRDGTTLGEQVKSVTYRGKDIGPRGDGVGIVSASIEVTIEFVEDLANP